MLEKVDVHKQRKLTREQESFLVINRYDNDYNKYLYDLGLHSDYYMIDEYNELLDEMEGFI